MHKNKVTKNYNSAIYTTKSDTLSRVNLLPSEQLTLDSPSRTEISTASNVAQHNHYNWYHVEIYHIELSS